jgi:hypothetical protein
MTTTFLRAALVTHGVLEPRPEQTAKFDLAAARLLREVPARQDRAQLRAFSLWQVQHDLARRERHGHATRKSAGNSIRLVRAAVELSAWAAAHGMMLAQLRQEDLDRWIDEGPSTTASIRPFLKWAARGRLIAPLQAAPRTARGHADALSNEARLGVVRRLLRDQTIDLRDRVGGCLLLIYAQPLTRIVGLSVDRVTVAGDRVTITLGNGPLELPEPLAQLTATLARTRRARASTAAAAAASPLLFPGMRVGRPLDYTYFQRRLNRLGIPPLAGRKQVVPTRRRGIQPLRRTIDRLSLTGEGQRSRERWRAPAVARPAGTSNPSGGPRLPSRVRSLMSGVCRCNRGLGGVILSRGVPGRLVGDQVANPSQEA